jgi:hypothetical protein
MRRRLIASAWSAGAAQPGQALQPLGSCDKPGGPAVRDWWREPGGRRTQARSGASGVVGGRLLCYTTPQGWSALEWTDTSYDVYSIAYGRSRYGLYRWWRVRGGPAA